MTVGIAALAANGQAFVLCADRQHTTKYDVRHEGRIAKKRELAYGWRFLLEDNATRADEVEDAILERFPPVGEDRETPMTFREMLKVTRSAFLDVRKATMESGVLEDDPDKEFDLGLLLVGFDENNEARGVRIFENGDYEDIRHIGYGAVGSGGEAAEATLAHYRVPMDDPLERVLYKVYEAKRRADRLVSSVGETTDMWIVTSNSERQRLRHQTMQFDEGGTVEVPKFIKDTMSEVFDWIASPPWGRKLEPTVWASTLARYAQEVMDGKCPRY